MTDLFKEWGLQNSVPAEQGNKEKPKKTEAVSSRAQGDDYNWFYRDKNRMDMTSIRESSSPLYSGSIAECEQFMQQRGYENIGQLKGAKCEVFKLQTKDSQRAIMLRVNDTANAPWGIYVCTLFMEPTENPEREKDDTKKTLEDFDDVDISGEEDTFADVSGEERLSD